MQEDCLEFISTEELDINKFPLLINGIHTGRLKFDGDEGYFENIPTIAAARIVDHGIRIEIMYKSLRKAIRATNRALRKRIKKWLPVYIRDCPVCSVAKAGNETFYIVYVKIAQII